MMRQQGRLMRLLLLLLWHLPVTNWLPKEPALEMVLRTGCFLRMTRHLGALLLLLMMALLTMLLPSLLMLLLLLFLLLPPVVCMNHLPRCLEPLLEIVITMMQALMLPIIVTVTLRDVKRVTSMSIASFLELRLVLPLTMGAALCPTPGLLLSISRGKLCFAPVTLPLPLNIHTTLQGQLLLHLPLLPPSPAASL